MIVVSDTSAITAMLKKEGLIPSLRELTAEIETKVNFRVADQVKEYLFRQAGE